MKPLYRGIWADNLQEGDNIPVGGSLFNPEELTTKLLLDFKNLNQQQLEKALSKDNFNGYLEHMLEPFAAYVKNNEVKVDAEDLLLCDYVNKHVQKILEFDPHNPTNSFERLKLYDKSQGALSELVGNAMCGEQAALGQYVLQHIKPEGYDSALMVGVIGRPELRLEDHSFIPITNPQGEQFVFDIARPHITNNVPRIMRMDTQVTPEIFEGKKNYLVTGECIFGGAANYYGVGCPMDYQEPIIHKNA